MKKWLLTTIAKWCLSRLKNYGKLPVGLPGHRDPDSRCAGYQTKDISDSWARFRDCETDGHYLCKKCIHRIEEKDEEEL